MPWIYATEPEALGLGVMLLGRQCYGIPDAFGINEVAGLVEVNVTSETQTPGVRRSHLVGEKILRCRSRGAFRAVSVSEMKQLPPLYLDRWLGWVDATGRTVDDVSAEVLSGAGEEREPIIVHQHITFNVSGVDADEVVNRIRLAADEIVKIVRGVARPSNPT